jgi:hypothetical protein
MHGQLVGLCAKEISFRADYVAGVELFVQLESLLADIILSNVELQLRALLLQVAETSSPLPPDSHQTAADPDLHPFPGKLLTADRIVFAAQGWNQVRERELSRVSGETQPFNVADLAIPLLKQLLFERQ